MLTIGLTGGIGSGKSTVTKILAELGAPIIDADQVGHTIYLPGGPAYDDMIAAFGESIIAEDGTVDRKKLGPIVFADPAALQRLNSILHPKMFARMRDLIHEKRAAGERLPIVIEAAILIEANWLPLFNEVWLVVATQERVIDRVERDRGLAREQTEARIRAQLSNDERRKHAALVIANDGTIDELRRNVKEVWQLALERNRD